MGVRHRENCKVPLSISAFAWRRTVAERWHSQKYIFDSSDMFLWLHFEMSLHVGTGISRTGYLREA